MERFNAILLATLIPLIFAPTGCRTGTISEGPRRPAGQPMPAEQAPPPSKRLSDAPAAAKLLRSVESHFAGEVGRRIYIQLDKPIYQPGETIWIKSWDLRTRDLAGKHDDPGIRYQLVSPRGSVVVQKLVQEENGLATNDLVLPPELRGGEYRIRAVTLDGIQTERPVLVSSYEPPRIKKKLEFLRKAYGPGDEVTATFEVRRPTGEPLAKHQLAAVVQIDGQALPRLGLMTDDAGDALVRFTLPSSIHRGDGLLTVLVEDAGITESITKRIPILLNRLRIAFFPEGGDLVAGLESRVYLSAVNMLGKPADLEGRVRDDRGEVVARFRSYYHGLGRFNLRPEPGRSYHLEISRPQGIGDRFRLPPAKSDGCVLRSYDDLDSRRPAIAVSVRCTRPQPVVVSAVLRERLIDAAAVQVTSQQPAVVYLASADQRLNRAQGTARVTLFDEQLTPLAERLLYRNRLNHLQVRVTTEKQTFTPRQKVTLDLQTVDSRGEPAPAELALSVVDDTVVSFADDKTGHMLSRLYLEPEIPFEVHEPNSYFDPKNDKAAKALDLLMGTAGYRRFAWRQVLSAPPPEPEQPQQIAHLRKWREPELEQVRPRHAPRLAPAQPPAAQPMAQAERLEPARQPRPPVAAQPRPAPAPALPPPPPQRVPPRGPPPPVLMPPADRRAAAPEPEAAAEEGIALEAPAPADRMMGLPASPRWRQRQRQHRKWKRERRRHAQLAGRIEEHHRKWQPFRREAVERPGAQPQPAWAVVRLFPAPTYRHEETVGRRTDFRETVHWAPRVTTGGNGKARVSFYLSDAVTSFRVFTEGVGAGMAGRDETVFKSSLPFSLNVKLPVEVSAEDRLELPLTLTNETDRLLAVELQARFAHPLRLRGPHGSQRVQLPPRGRKSLLYTVEVANQPGTSTVSFAARAGGLKDELTRRVRVVPLGFPVERSFSGEALGVVTHDLDLKQAVPGSILASVRLYPSPVATMVSGLEGILRQPTGCFEQASSSNYPNVMVMRYLKEHRVDDAKLVRQSTQLLTEGYRRLTGYESRSRGYEWFGGDPGHEALTAYGLMQFVDMAEVHDEVERPMIARTAAWLKAQRDGAGGYRRNPRALDSFGRASAEVTDAYITYSLTEAGQSGLETEISQQARLARETKDAYVLALATNSLLNAKAGQELIRSAAARLAGMQGTDGAWSNADHSITRSSGINLQIETTALAVLALLKAGAHQDKVRAAISWLRKNRGGYGQWGTTQATVLALRAMVAYAQSTSQTREPGEVRLEVNGKSAGVRRYKAGHRGPLVFGDIQSHLTRKNNRVTLVHQAREAMPYSIALSYRVRRPPSSPQATVDLSTSLSNATVKMGETVRLTAMVQNRTQQGLPMTLAWVGIPGGLSFQSWQLKELREKGLIAFYETQPREAILYFRQLEPGESKTIDLDLVAVLPGRYTGPASRAYLYYSDEHKTWAKPQTIVVTR